MRRLVYSELEKDQHELGAAISRRSDYLTTFCSELPWQGAALRNLRGFDFGIQSPGEPLIVNEDGNWLIFTERNPGVYFPFESAWMFGCPIIGDPVQSLDLLRRACLQFLGSGVGFVVSGVRENSEMQRRLIELAENSRRSDTFHTVDCLTIDLSDGFDAFLGRKSKSFRKGIRQMKKLDSLVFEAASALDPELVFERIFDIQKRSYKSKEGRDIFSDHRYEAFYRDLYGQLHERGGIRTLFAQIGEKDVAYIMGGVSSGVYRGFQMSYDEEYRAFALGNRLQLENIQRRSEEGVTHYDLGMHSPYKERWADRWERYSGVFMIL